MVLNQKSTEDGKLGKKLNVEIKQHTCKEKWVEEEIPRKYRQYLEMNKNGNQNVWTARKAVPRGKLLAINSYIQKKKGLKSTT